ncbi:hypothetical protein SUDANB38_01504 [Streptomyces sp. enrichment culture]
MSGGTAWPPVLLDVRPEGSAAYRPWGYRKAGEAIPRDGADLHERHAAAGRHGGAVPALQAGSRPEDVARR